MPVSYRFAPDSLRHAAGDVFAAAGSPPEEAALLARLLVAANLAGHDSHGVIRIPQYLGAVRAGTIRPGRHVQILADRGAVVRLSGAWGFGQTAASEATDLAIARAREHGVAAVGVAEANHMGRLSDFVVRAAEAGQAALLFAASGGFNKLVAPFGGSERRMNTNPLAFAAPAGPEGPVAFDIATSAYAQGKFRHFMDAGQEAPAGVLLDKEGRPTTNPADLYEGGAILPLGGAQGYKGYLLNFMIEVLGGILTVGGYMGHPKRQAGGNCMLLLCLDVAAFREPTAFQAELRDFVAYLKSTRPQPGMEVLAPGEVSARTAVRRSREGIPLPEATVDAVQAELDRYGVVRSLRDAARSADRGSTPGAGVMAAPRAPVR